MGAQYHAERQAKVTITCSYDERLYIKTLQALLSSLLF